jgi:hypothetical protein
MKKRTGKGSQDIFAATSPAHKDVSERQTNGEDKASISNKMRSPGRPPIHTEDWKKVTVVLLERQIVFLDRLALDIRQNTGVSIRRAEIIRALIDALEKSDIDPKNVSSESKLRDLMHDIINDGIK